MPSPGLASAVSPIAQGRMEIVVEPAAPPPPTRFPTNVVSLAVPEAMRKKFRPVTLVIELSNLPRTDTVADWLRTKSLAVTPATAEVPPLAVA